MQQGYFTARQAKELGYRAENHTYHVKEGNWLHIDRGLFRLPDFPTTYAAETWRWLLWTFSPDGRQIRGTASHQTALFLHGLLESQPESIHLTVPPDFSAAAGPALRLYRAALAPDETAAREGLALTTPLRTLLDVRAEYEAGGIFAPLLTRAAALGLVFPAQLQAAGLECPAPAELAAAPLFLAPEADLSPPVSVPAGAAALPVPTEDFFVPVDHRERSDSIRTPASAGALEKRSRLMNPEQDRTPVLRRRRQAGFTLVELLVVVAIISVLAAMLLPALEKSLASARQIACANNYKQNGIVFHLYADSYTDCFPAVCIEPYYSNNWYHRLSPFAGKEWPIGAYPVATDIKSSIFNCPTFKLHGTSTGYLGLGMNPWLETRSGTYFDQWRACPRREKLVQPASRILVSDSGDFFLGYGSYTSYNEPKFDLFRHGGGCNILYADGHVAWRAGNLIQNTDL